MSDFSKLLAAYAATQLGDQITLLALPLIAALVLGSGPVEMGWLAVLSRIFRTFDQAAAPDCVTCG